MGLRTQRGAAAAGSGSVPAAPASGAAGAGTSSLTTSMLNLSKNIIGAGILSLPFAMKGAGVVPFLLGALVFGALNAYTFFLLGWCCHSVRAGTFGELWSKTFGQQSAWVADLAVLTNNCLACLAYCVVAGDFLSKALEALLPGLPLLHWRGANLALVGVSLLFPLSILKDMAPLRFSSIAGLVATLYGFLLVTGDCASSVNLSDPAGAVQQNFFPLRVDLFQALALVSSAFMAHYNSPKFYAGLEDNTISRWGTLVAGAFGLAFFAFSTFALAGFALFGFGVEGNVLTNYPQTTQAMLAWLGMALSMIFTYPLLFNSLRDAAAAMLIRFRVVSDAASDGFRIPFTALVVSLTVLGGTVFNNVAVVNGVKGAVLSACLAFIFPAVIHLRLSGPQSPVSRANGADAWAPAMRTGDVVLIVVGLVTGVLALLAMFVLPKTDFSALAAATAAAAAK